MSNSRSSKVGKFVANSELIEDEKVIELARIIQNVRSQIVIDFPGLESREIDAKVMEKAKFDYKLRKAVHELINANLKLIPHVIKVQNYTQRADIEELCQEGAIGLQIAALRYKTTVGAKFSTFAYWWIWQAVARFIQNHGNAIRIPIHVIDSLSKVKTKTKDFFNDNGRMPTIKELSDATGYSETKLQNLKEARQKLKTKSYDEHLGSDHDNTLLIEMLGEFNNDYSDELDLIEVLELLMENLTPKEKEVIKLRFGINSDHEWSLRSIGDLTNLSRERIRQIEQKALQKMRNNASKKQITHKSVF